MNENRRVEERRAEGEEFCEVEIDGVEGMFGFWKWGGVGRDGGGEGMGWDGMGWDGMDRYTKFLCSRVFTYDHDLILLLLRGEGG